jgi:hypothetical protein
VEVTYEGILSLKEQLDRIETRLAHLEHPPRPAEKLRARSPSRVRLGDHRQRR